MVTLVRLFDLVLSIQRANTRKSKKIITSIMDDEKVHLSTSLVDEDSFFGKESLVSSYPPLANLPIPQSNKRYYFFCVTLSYRELQYMEWLQSSMGSVMFVVGSYLFFPEADCGDLNCELPGAVLFLVGSTLFCIASTLLFVRSDAGSWEDRGLSINASLYILANFMFVVGSYLFIPSVEDELEDGQPIPGVILFIIGSFIFFFAPIYDLMRTARDRRAGNLSTLRFATESVVSLGYIIGSGLFVIGSFLFLPQYYDPWAAPLFLIGSVFFLIATMAELVADSIRHVQRAYGCCTCFDAIDERTGRRGSSAEATLMASSSTTTPEKSSRVTSSGSLEDSGPDANSQNNVM